MLKQSSLKLTIFLFAGDIVLTTLALYLAKVLRLSLPYLEFPWFLYPTVALIWVAVFLTIPVYDVRKTYRFIDQVQTTVTGIGFATLIFAGIAYFFFRELSRFLFVYFFCLNLVLLLGFRVALRLFFRIRQGGWPGRRTRLLILGAGRVGRRVAEMLQDYAFYGVEVVGFLDDDAAKQDLCSMPCLAHRSNNDSITMNGRKRLLGFS
jgi:FlaA1/EpsC-like NDP-sugar epimerase